jgi:TonB family protein
MTQTDASLNVTQSIVSCGDKPVPIVTIKYAWVWYAVLSLYGLSILLLLVQGSPVPLTKAPIIQAELWQNLPSLDTVSKPIVASNSVNLQPNSSIQTVATYIQKKPSSPTVAIAKTVSIKASTAILKPADKVVVLPVKKPAEANVAFKKIDKNSTKNTDKSVNKSIDKPIDKKSDSLKNLADSKAKDTIAAVIAKEAAYLKRINQMKALASSNATVTSNRPQTASTRDLGAGWGEKLKQCVQPNLRYSDASASNPRVEFMVKLSAVGSPNSVNLTKSSGNNAYDLAVERALRRCDPFPKPISGEYPLSIRVGYSLNH